MRWILIGLSAAVLALALSPLLVSGGGPTDVQPASSTGPEPGAEAESAPPERNTTADPRPATRRPAASDPVADVITTVLIDIARGKTDERSVKAMEERVESTLASEGLGEGDQRRAAAAGAVRTVLRRAEEARKAGAPLGDLKLRAVKALARQLARELRTRLPAGEASQDHQGSMRALAPEADVPDGYQKVGWQTLAGFDYVEGERLPAAVRALDGDEVGISGYMISLEEDERGIRQFLLVRSLWDCCFGAPPELHQGIVVTTERPGLQFTSEPIQALGTLDVGEDRDSKGFVLSVYRIRAEKIAVIE